MTPSHQLAESRRMTTAGSQPPDRPRSRPCAAGYDPTTTPEAERRRAARASQERKALAAWRDDGSLDGVDFRRDQRTCLARGQTSCTQLLDGRARISRARSSVVRVRGRAKSGLLFPDHDRERHGSIVLGLLANTSGRPGSTSAAIGSLDRARCKIAPSLKPAKEPALPSL